MSTLVVIGYDDPFKAEEVRLTLRKAQKDYLSDLEDSVVAVKDKNGAIKLHRAVEPTASATASGGFWGTLVSEVFSNPLLGMVGGAGVGGVPGALADVGVDDKFMKELAATLAPGSSVLCVLVRAVTQDKVLHELAGTGGKLLKTSLAHDDEAKLRAALRASGR